MVKIESRISVDTREVLRLCERVDPDFDIDDYARTSGVVNSTVLRAIAGWIYSQPGCDSEFEWLCNNCGAPYAGDLFVDVFYEEDTEVRLRWMLTDAQYTGFVLAQDD